MPSSDEELRNAFLLWINDYGDRVFQISQETLVADGKIDTGNLLRSGNVNRTIDGVEIVYTAPYASNVEDGREEGSMPPVEPIQRWAQRKLGIPAKEARNVAFAIATAIKQRGIQQSPYVRPALEAAARELGGKYDA